MLIQERLDRAKQEQQKVILRLNNLEREKQELLQEALRIDGRIQILNELLQEEAKVCKVKGKGYKIVKEVN